MGRYSSDSGDSRSSRHKRSKRSQKRSSKGRSRSRSPKRCKKKLKKYKRSNRSLSRDTKNRHSSDRKSRYKHRSRSHSDSPSDRRRRQSSSKDSERDRRYKDDYKKPKARRRHRSSSSTSSSTSSSSYSSKSKSDTPKRKFDYDPDELLEKLNKAAVEAMAANKKIKQDPLSTLEMQIKRQDTINELRGNSSSSLSEVLQVGTRIPNPMTLPAPLLSAKLSDKLPADDAPVVVDLAASGLCSAPSAQSTTSSESLLHPNFLLENQEEKLNRWVKKLYQIRQRAMNGEMLTV